MIKLILPYPPSINHLYGQHGKIRYMKEAGKRYKTTVGLIANRIKKEPELLDKANEIFIVVDIYPPDRRKRDIDNLGKIIFDSLQGAGVYKDDAQIALQIFRRRYEVEAFKGGGYIVVVVGLRVAFELQTFFATND